MGQSAAAIFCRTPVSRFPFPCFGAVFHMMGSIGHESFCCLELVSFARHRPGEQKVEVDRQQAYCDYSRNDNYVKGGFHAYRDMVLHGRPHGEYGKDASHYSGHGIKMLVPDDKGDIFQQDIP